MSDSDYVDLTLVVRHTINSDPETLFDHWTQPNLLMKWWGPKNVTCIAAEVNLNVGGLYRITNKLADNKILIISGIFEDIDRPNKLVYSWGIDTIDEYTERVTVLFRSRGNKTEVIVNHERIGSEESFISHQLGWQGCLEKLSNLSLQIP